MRGGSLLLFICSCFYFFPSPPIRSGEAFSSVIVSSLSLLLFVFWDVAMVWKGKPASVTTGSRDRTYVRKIIRRLYEDKVDDTLYFCGQQKHRF